jgi:serine phosphatase RsbU (regulator of sigma subunit)
MNATEIRESLHILSDELENFTEIVQGILPESGDIPDLAGIDMFGRTLPLTGQVGGDHIIYVDFKKRYDLHARIEKAQEDERYDVADNLKRLCTRGGIALIDVSGHRTTDALLVAMMHQAFMLGALYELDMFGQITEHVFENLNTRFYKTATVTKYITMIYGEIIEDGTFRFLSAAMPPPIVFSNAADRFMEVSGDLFRSYPPLGTLPSKNVIDRKATRSLLGFKDQYLLNEWALMGAGDILLLYTDGLRDHHNGSEPYFPERLEHVVRTNKFRSAREICEAIEADVRAFGELEDDVSVVVIKRS